MFRKGRRCSTQEFQYAGNKVERGNLFNYLGITFTSSCLFIQRAKNNIKKTVIDS